METVLEYIHSFPEEVQNILHNIRAMVLKLAPDAEESIAYKMPAYKTNKKPLVYYAAFKNHIGFYATPTGHEVFAEEMSKYKHGKGSVQFPFNQPIPYHLIERIILFRIKENKMNS